MLQPPNRARRLWRLPADAGIGLIEVVVAMVVFGVVATGIIGSISISIRMTPDNESREVAANLAGQEIDLVRAVGDPYEVGARETTQTINGVTYTIDRTTGWLQPNGIAGACGASTANFELKVNVDVSWTGQAKTTQDVRSDTLMAPLSQLTSGTTGSVAVYVTDSQGQSQSGVSLAVSPSATNPNGASTPASQPAATGTDGCSYLGKLTPGNYDVTATRDGPSGTETATAKTNAVAAGSTATVDVSLDGSGTLKPNPADNQGGDTVVPKDLVTTYLTGTGLVASSAAASVVVPTSTSGYMAVAGKLGPANGTTTCAEFDPAAWGAGTSNGKALGNGEREAALPLTNNQTRTIGVPMGTVSLQNANGLWVRAVQVTPQGAGNPGCSSLGTTVHFPQITTDDVDLALPYGTWQLYEGPAEILELIPVTALQITGTSDAAGGGVAVSGVVTIDPRLP